jgi:5-methylcytosine-specific restriction endonuclease McrA
VTRARKPGQGSKWCRPSTRLALYARDGFCCVYCGASADEGAQLTLDHVLACELGGSNDAANLVTACLSCNSAKRDRTMREWYAALRDTGVDTNAIGARVRRQTKKNIDRKLGRELLAARKES